MIPLQHYIIDTQGKLPPEDILNYIGIFNIDTGERFHAHVTGADFLDIDGRMERYVVKPRFLRTVDGWGKLFILTNKAERILYG